MASEVVGHGGKDAPWTCTPLSSVPSFATALQKGRPENILSSSSHSTHLHPPTQLPSVTDTTHLHRLTTFLTASHTLLTSITLLLFLTASHTLLTSITLLLFSLPRTHCSTLYKRLPSTTPLPQNNITHAHDGRLQEGDHQSQTGRQPWRSEERGAHLWRRL